MISRANGPNESYSDSVDVDLSGIQFASDSISIRFLRQRFPELFDKGFEEGHGAQPKFFFNSTDAGHAEAVLAHLLHCERRIAVSAYLKTKGLPPLECDIDEFKDELIDLYVRYEFATGRHAAEQLIREIERQGQELARGKNL